MSNNKYPIKKVTTDVLMIARAYNEFEIHLIQDGKLQRQGLIALRDRIDAILEETESDKAAEKPAETPADKPKESAPAKAEVKIESTPDTKTASTKKKGKKAAK